MIKKRNILLSIILEFITFDIYSFYWIYKLSEEAYFGSDGRFVRGGKAILLLLVTVLLYGIPWAYQMGNTIDAIKAERGMKPKNRGILYAILFAVFHWGCLAMIQAEMNELAEI